MSGHKEKAEWKTAEDDLRRDGKRTYGRRPAPFYKVCDISDFGTTLIAGHDRYACCCGCFPLRGHTESQRLPLDVSLPRPPSTRADVVAMRTRIIIRIYPSHGSTDRYTVLRQRPI